jgi:hypothetical protein
LETKLNTMGETAASLRRKIATGEVELVDDDALLNTINGMSDELTVLFDTYRVRLDPPWAAGRGPCVCDGCASYEADRFGDVG